MSNNFEYKIKKLTEIYSRKIRNKKITKGLIMASYDDSSLRGNVNDLILTQVDNERKSGNFYLNHLILRDSTAEIDNHKPLYLIDGVPAVAYVLNNLTESNLEKIATVGNKGIELTTESFIDLYDPNQEIVFNDEGKKKSLKNTLLKGKEKLNSYNELVFICPGDVPFLYDVNKIIRNRKCKKYEAVLNLNIKQKIGKYFPRNFHLGVGRFDIKEPNIFSADLNNLPYDLIEILFDYRKFYADNKNRQIPIKKEEIEELVKSYWKEPAILRAIPKLVSKFPGADWKTKLISFLIKQYTRFDKDIPRISHNAFEGILCLISNMKIKVLLTNNDPATLEDMDSYEDWCYMNQMMIKGKSDIYPHYDKAQKFKKVMPELRKNIPLLENFEEYINDTFKKFGLFDKPYYADGSPFLLRAPYNAKGELDIAFAKKEVDKMINDNIKLHKSYLTKYKARQLFRKEYK